MARYRLSGPAKVDVSFILRTSEAQHGREARSRYRGLLSATMRRVAAEPHGPLTQSRGELLAGLRSLHMRHCRKESREGPVAEPVHVLYYRVVEPGLIEIVRVLHDRMEPSRQLSAYTSTPGSR